MPIPADPSLLGMSPYFQGVALTAGAPGSALPRELRIALGW